MTRWELDLLEDWCRQYGGKYERPGPREIRCDFGKNTYLVLEARGRTLLGEAYASVDGQPEHIEGEADVDADHGAYTVTIDGYHVEPRDSMGGTVLAARRAGGGEFDFTGGGL